MIHGFFLLSLCTQFIHSRSGKMHRNPGKRMNDSIRIVGILGCQKKLVVTLPETNIAPENGWLEYWFPFGIAYFQGLC